MGNKMKIIVQFPKYMVYLFNKIYNFLILRYKKVYYGKEIKILGKISVHGSGKIKIGNSVTINSSAASNPTSGFDKTYLRTEPPGIIQIGNHVGISSANITAFNSVTIEDYVMIGSGVKIWDTDFHSVNFDNRITNTDIVSKPILIKRGAFVGACSIILKGVTIGERAVIGAGSVVTKNIPDDEVWAGNPAKFIRKC